MQQGQAAQVQAPKAKTKAKTNKDEGEGEGEVEELSNVVLWNATEKQLVRSTRLRPRNWPRRTADIPEEYRTEHFETAQRIPRRSIPFCCRRTTAEDEASNKTNEAIRTLIKETWDKYRNSNDSRKRWKLPHAVNAQSWGRHQSFTGNGTAALRTPSSLAQCRTHVRPGL